MQLHIVGSNVTLDNHRAKEELAVVLAYLGVNAVVEERFSGASGAGVVLVPPADVSGIDSSCPVVVLDLNGDMRPELIGVERADGIAPVGVIQTPLSQEQLGTALRAIRSRHALRLSSQTRDLLPAHAGIVARVPGDHPILDSLRVGIGAAADQDGSVLIRGETGTGKRQIAEAVYLCSKYSDGPFVPVSCATFPESLLAIELFGCESGALPGFNSRRIGRIEMAESGVLLLEDIEALSVQSQASLLAFLRSKRLERVGSTRGAPCDVRLIASTSANLEQLVEQGTFREDLFYALQNMVLDVPALRKYVVALPGILSELNAEFQTGLLSDDAWKALHRYSWPGNLKELENFASQTGATSGDGVIDVEDLPPRISGNEQGSQLEDVVSGGSQADVLLPINGLDLKSYLSTLEKNLINQALEDTGFVVARAADRLHIRRTTLVEKIRKYGLRRG